MLLFEALCHTLTFDRKGLTVGRKPFLALCMVGKLGGAVFNLLNAIYLEEWSRWVDTLDT